MGVFSIIIPFFLQMIGYISRFFAEIWLDSGIFVKTIAIVLNIWYNVRCHSLSLFI